MLFSLIFSHADDHASYILDTFRVARAGLTQYHISGSHSRISHNPDKLTESYDFEIWRDGNRIRYDQFDKSIDTNNVQHQAQFNTRAVLCVNCVKQGYSVRYRDGLEIAILPTNHVRGGKQYMANIETGIIDIMSIGANYDLQTYNRSESYQLVPGSQYDLLEDSASRLVAVNRLRPIRRTYSLAGRKITSIETVVGSPTEDKYITVASFDNCDGIFGLPAKITHRCTILDQPYNTITQTFNYHSFNKPIDASVFTLRGLNIKDGTVVDDGDFTKGSKLVFGGKIRPYVATPKQFRQAAEDYQKLQPGPIAVAPPPRRTWLYALSCVTLASFGVLLLRKALRRV